MPPQWGSQLQPDPRSHNLRDVIGFACGARRQSTPHPRQARGLADIARSGPTSRADSVETEEVLPALPDALSAQPGQSVEGRTIAEADAFDYLDLIDGSVRRHPGLRLQSDGAPRIVFRLSSTSTPLPAGTPNSPRTGINGATLRVDLERYEGRQGILDAELRLPANTSPTLPPCRPRWPTVIPQPS